jgi:RNase P/RNase MRP subunit p29
MKENYILTDLIGLKIRVIYSTNPLEKNIQGLVLFQTKNMIHINYNSKILKLSKNNLYVLIENLDLIINCRTINNNIYTRKTLYK